MKFYPFLLLLFTFCTSKQNNEFIVADESSVTTIYVDESTDELVKWAVADLASDIEQMTGKNVQVVAANGFSADLAGIYVGVLNDQLIESSPAGYQARLSGQWEKFIIRKESGSLFLVGSDVRGTVYAVFELAERIGVSHWKWWADVTPGKSASIKLALPAEGIEESPSVQYRGIFLNDEDWGLQPWAAKTFEPETGDIGPKTYEKIFQLLLRLKANTIWPAMHPSTKAFFQIPGNKEMAEKYHISIGTSHAEPMLRNNVDEWDEDVYGDFNYFTNSERVKQYWQERITEARHGNNIYSLGMRGVHDSGMQGDATTGEKVELLETIIADQREMLVNSMDKPIEEVPQVFTLYKEVLDLYNEGLKVPDDVTLMWTDDNYGYIRRLSDEAERKRKGGSGVYYHLSYWGRPHDYLWLSTTQPGLIWYEMTKAYENGARKIWIANVGDIKPGEYDIELFLDLAWDINSVSEATIEQHLIDWCARAFGDEGASEIADVLQEYYRLAMLRKPEYMGWSQTEPITPTRMSEFSTKGSNNEVQRRVDAYAKLVGRVDKIKTAVSEDRRDAYFQLVEYPVKGAALMNDKFLLAQQSFVATDPAEKLQLADKAQNAYEQIATLTEKYNTGVSNGKWEWMMSMHPRDLPVYAMPDYHLSPPSDGSQSAGESPQDFQIAIQANEFVASKGAENYEWKAIEGLGYSAASVTLFPFESHIFSNELPYLEYQFSLEKAGSYELEVRCLPTHANQYDFEVGIEVNQTGRRDFPINTRGRSEEWKTNVLRNFVSVMYPFTTEKAGIQTVRIYVNQTGIVIDQLAVVPKGQSDYYEIVRSK
ncbi:MULTISPECIES: glycosyl hydrolase 115 family protein [unclassified Imperialibacter]|uniref:glycosyl hydrolase 115 family protein n=1 Tax=unclassified Imperialibacter TaxID=2629706 RepID=UPI001252C738|nr:MULTISPECIES: glycosyl hydrolase 115 family protein [unclassified Imperialibacter]CAD5283255.1 Glycosyl hydrolase family 67 [Imperialibacter sp. 89]CAD5286314.1 Glycosyl hydrolase family 67 [Imperialibacter sp. 75]VVT29876.1 Glycosyl hydrolase [Imperialibacter sp. EC-SDR9]